MQKALLFAIRITTEIDEPRSPSGLTKGKRFTARAWERGQYALPSCFFQVNLGYEVRDHIGDFVAVLGRIDRLCSEKPSSRSNSGKGTAIAVGLNVPVAGRGNGSVCPIWLPVIGELMDLKDIR